MAARVTRVACCLALLGVSAGAIAAEEETAVESKVVRVTVYPEWAYVTRRAEVELKEGPARFAFKGLPAWIDDESMRATIDGAKGARIAGVSAKTTHLARSTEAEVRKAEAEVRKLTDEIEDLNNEFAVVGQEEHYLSGIWKKDGTPPLVILQRVEVDEIDAVRKYVFAGVTDAVKRATGIRRRIRDLQPELTAKQKTLADLKGRTRLERKVIVVEVESETAARAGLSVSYLISGASWYPSYDARTDRDKSKIQMTCTAVVQQTTGEDWSGASFTLSTIQPYLTREKPELRPWYVSVSTAQTLSAYQSINVEPQAQLSQGTRYSQSPSASARMKRLRQKQRAGQMAEDLLRFQPNLEKAQAMVRQVEERGTTVEFDIAGSYSVKADGKPVKLPIGQTELAAGLRFSAVPVASRSTYVTGEMRNGGEFPFLPGDVKVYVDGSLIGKAKVPFVAEGEKFELYLGLEERIKVTRELDARKSSTSRSGSKKRFVAAYRIEIKSFLKATATIEVRDQVPVSQDKGVKVKLLSVEPETDTPEKGIVTWEVYLSPGESKELRFEFRVDYPAGVYVGNAAALEMEIKAKK